MYHRPAAERATSGPITPLDESTVNTFTPYSFYSSAAYCGPAKTLAWDCGEACEGNPSFIPTASGGNGGNVQFCSSSFSFLLAVD